MLVMPSSAAARTALRVQGVRGLRTRDRKLIATHDPASDDLVLELYDLDNDPFECSDLAATEPNEVARLAARLSRRLESIHDPWAGASLLSREPASDKPWLTQPTTLLPAAPTCSC